MGEPVHDTADGARPGRLPMGSLPFEKEQSQTDCAGCRGLAPFPEVTEKENN